MCVCLAACVCVWGGGKNVYEWEKDWGRWKKGRYKRDQVGVSYIGG